MTIPMATEKLISVLSLPNTITDSASELTTFDQEVAGGTIRYVTHPQVQRISARLEKHTLIAVLHFTYLESWNDVTAMGLGMCIKDSEQSFLIEFYSYRN